MMITQERLKKVLHYNPETGIFTWLSKLHQSMTIGSVAGYHRVGEYTIIGIDGKDYKAHRLAWLYMEGYFPEHEIDHINGIKDDNRWCNLRHATHQCNIRNRKIFKNNTSGVTGVSWDKQTSSWAATIMVDGSTIRQGRFKDFNKAVITRWQAEVKHNFPNCQTTSSAYLYLKENNLI